MATIEEMAAESSDRLGQSANSSIVEEIKQKNSVVYDVFADSDNNNSFQSSNQMEDKSAPQKANPVRNTKGKKNQQQAPVQK